MKNNSILNLTSRKDQVDEKIIVEDEEAFKIARLLAIKEGLFIGMSSGAVVAGALHTAKDMDYMEQLLGFYLTGEIAT